jgi:hypothetical protein
MPPRSRPPTPVADRFFVFYASNEDLSDWSVGKSAVELDSHVIDDAPQARVANFGEVISTIRI